MFGLEYGFVLFLVPFFIYCLYRCKDKNKPRYFVHLERFDILKGGFDKLFWYKVATIFWLFVALASLVHVNIHDPKNRKGINIVLSIDASGSMTGSGFDSSDIQKTKFQSVKEVVTRFIHKRLRDNVGIVLFGDFAFVASPLTYEKEALAQMVEYLTLGMAGHNTAIGEGIHTAAQMLKNVEKQKNIIILLTDGMHNAGAVSIKEALKLAQNKAITVYTIGIGAPHEYDQALLEQIAHDSGGEFFGATSLEDLANVYETINKLEPTNIRSKDFEFKTYYYFLPLLLSMLFLALYTKLKLGSQA